MIVVDVETTGLHYEKNSIVSIGAVEFERPENQFYEECRIFETAEISSKALEINGFTIEQITNPKKQSLEEAIRKFILWTQNIDDKTLAGENPIFDMLFLRTSALRYGFEWEKIGSKEGTGRAVDLHSISYANHKKRGISIPLKNNRTDINLNYTLKYVGLQSESDPHNALTGAKMEAEAFSRLIYGKNLLKEFELCQVPHFLKA